MTMNPQQAKELADSYKERQQKYEQKLFVRIKRYFQKRKEEKDIQRKMNYYMIQIKYTALHGGYSLHVNEYMHDDFRLDRICFERLQKIGYNVTSIFEHNTIKHTISWNKGG